MSCAGVTGARAKTEARVEGLISSLGEATDMAICVGFGVSGPDQVRAPTGEQLHLHQSIARIGPSAVSCAVNRLD